MARLIADDVRDIGAIQKRWVSLKDDLMFFVDELPNAEPGGPIGIGRLRDESSFLDA